MTIGTNISQVLDESLTYTTLVVAEGVPLVIIIPSVVGGVVVVVIVMLVMLIIFVFFYLNFRRKSVSIAMHEQIVELVATG